MISRPRLDAETSVEHIANWNGVGRDAVRGWVTELERAGYLKREPMHALTGKFAATEWRPTDPFEQG